MRDHENRLLGAAYDRDEFVLNIATRQRIERTEGLIEQQHLGLNRKGTRNTDALLHAARKL